LISGSVYLVGGPTVSSIGGNGVFAFIVKRFRVFRAPLHQRLGYHWSSSGCPSDMWLTAPCSAR
ncbi:hypothetical protein ABLN67_20230, partial [Mycobacterium tuberculosis]